MLVCLLLTLATPTHADTDSFDVFLNSSMSKSKPGVFFVDARTGLSSIVVTNGTQHTLLKQGVLFQEIGTGTVKVAYADGHIDPFTPIPQPDSTTTLRWIISPNREWLAWSASRNQNNTLSSDLYLLQLSTSTSKLVLHASSTKGVDTLPISVTDDGAAMYYTRVATDPKAYQLFAVAGDLFRFDTKTGASTQLPIDSPCSCATTLTADGRLVARLETDSQRGGFDLRLYDLTIKTNRLFQAPQITVPQLQAGNLLISPAGDMIIYTSARATPPTKYSPPEQYMLMLISVGSQQHRVLASGLSLNLRPLAFSKDNSSVLLAGIDKDGTYKLTLKDGTLLQDSAYSYLGTVTG